MNSNQATTRILMMMLCAVCMTFGASVAHSQEGDQTYRTSKMRSDGFTEPYEDIEVAVTETGIIESVLAKLGQSVNRGQLLMSLDSKVLKANLKTAESRANGTSKLRAAEIEHQIRSQRFEKVSELLEQGAARPEEVKRAQADAEVASQQVTSAREQSEIHRWEVEELKARIEQRKIRSPIDGVIVDLYKKHGEHVSVNDPLVARVVNLRNIRVIFHLPTQLALKMRVDDRVRVVLPETEQTTAATVEYVAPITSADSGRVRVDMLIDNADGAFRSGIRCHIEDPRIGKIPDDSRRKR